MRLAPIIVILGLGVFAGRVGVSADMPARPSEADIHAALRHWTEALGSGRGAVPVAALYSPDAILLATFDPKPLTTPAEIAAYFGTLTRNPDLKATVEMEKIHLFADSAVDSGLYTFTYRKGAEEVRVPARFTFVFRRTPAGWLIVSHHSSVLPGAH